MKHIIKHKKVAATTKRYSQKTNTPHTHVRQHGNAKRFLRYIVSGCCATVVNLAFVWISRQITSYELAVLIGAIFGTATTYIMTKIFVFERKRKVVDYSEILRFLCVHGIVCLQIWVVSVSLERWILPMLEIAQYQEPIASFIGVGSVVFTGYFLHRHVTYRVDHSPA